MARATPQLPCQIYLAAPEDADTGMLGRLLATGQIASLMLHGPGGGPPAQDAADALAPLAHAHGIPLVIARDAGIALRGGANGVHIPANEGLYTPARQSIGSDAIVGVDCGVSRHDALTLAELGADYVAFGAPPGGTASDDDVTGLVSWWQEVCEPPVVAWHRGGWEEATQLIAAGADFILISDLVLKADAPETSLDRLSGLIAEQNA